MLLKTRFYLPPLRPQCVWRQPLLDRLNQSPGGGLTLVMAPAGYGKTTLVSQWLHACPHTFTWLSLDKSHNSPSVFWRYALAALQQIQPSLGGEAERLAQQAPQKQADLVISLLNDLEDLSVGIQSDQPVSLILDDFHLLQNPLLLDALNLFLDHLPAGIRVVMTSRDEPPLMLPRRRAMGQVTLLTSEELRFSLPDSERFFNQTLQLALASDAISRFHHDTEGWITGLQLISYSAHFAAPHDSKRIPMESRNLDRHIADYLFDEVFRSLAPELQTFLLTSALPRRFCAGLCNALTGTNQALQHLATLEKANLFLVPLDNCRVWFRLHDLFRQFLLQQMELPEHAASCTQAVEGIEWLRQAGHYEDGIALSIRLQQWPQIEALIQLLQMLSPEGTLSDDATRLIYTVPATAYAPDRYPILHMVRMADETPTATVALKDEDEQGTDLILVGAEPLTRRELQVLTLIRQGLSNKDISDTLFISLNTLKVHIRNLYGKAGVENRTQFLLKLAGPK